MPLFKRGDVWWYQFYYRGGRYRESTRTTSKTLAADIARSARRAVESAAFGVRPAPQPVQFSVAAKDWMTLKTPSWRPKTLVAVTLDMKRLTAHFGKQLLTDITGSDISRYVAARQRAGASAKTLRNEVGTLRSLLNRYGLWQALKATGVKLPALVETEIGIALSPEQETKLLAACGASRSRSLLPAVTLALHTGLREGELRTLRWAQIDLARHTLRVGASKTAAGSGRVVLLNGRALATLTAWAAQFPGRTPEHSVFPREHVGLAGDDAVPHQSHVDPTTPISSWKTAWTTAREVAGVSCRFHDLRHTVVTRLLESGQPFGVIPDIMGWSPATTVRMIKRYGHIGSVARRTAMAALEAVAG